MSTHRPYSLLRVLFVIGLILAPARIPASRITHQDILSSFSNTAFAETSTYATCFDTSFTNLDPNFSSNALCDQSVEIQEYCQPEQTATSLTAYHVFASINQPGQILNASVSQNTGILASPLVSFTPGNVSFSEIYDPTSKSESQPFSFTTPSVSSGQGDIVLPIDIFGHFKNGVTADFRDQIRANVQVDHVGDTAPTLASSSATSYTVPVGGSTDVPVSFTVTDAESNHSDLSLQLSSDNFATVLQSHSFTAAATGSTLSYTFTGLPVGNYTWRVVATETDPATACSSLVTPPPTTFSVIDPATGSTSALSTYNYSGPGSMVCSGTDCTYTPDNATDAGQYALTVDSRPIDLILNPLGAPGPVTAPALATTANYTFTVGLAAVPPVSTPAIQKATVTNHLFYDKNANTKQDAGEPNLVKVKVTVTDTDGPQTVTTDTAGNISAQVSLGQVTMQIDPNDPNLPKGYRITTGNNSQKLTVTSLASFPFPAVGYTTSKFLPNAGSNQVPTFVIAIGALLSALYVTLNGRRSRLTAEEAPAETAE